LFPVQFQQPVNKSTHSQKKRYKSCRWGCTFSKVP